MKDFFIYIDDSGSPGQPLANKFQAHDAKIWAAVILCLEDKKYIENTIEIAIKKIQKEISFSEFHFTEIYSGKKDFKGIDSRLRLVIFELFVALYNRIRPYVIVTAAGIGTLKNSGFSESYINTKENGFDFSNPGDYALNTLLLLTNDYFIVNYKDDNIRVEITVDEGRQKSNTIQILTDSFGVCKKLNYKSSAKEYCLQFIDFIAFSINRIQNNYSKNRSEFDNEFMKIIGSLQLNTNLKMMTVSNLEDINKDLVESYIEKQGIASNESIQYIEELSKHITKMKEAISKKSSIEINNEILQDIIKLKQVHSNSMSDEFKTILDDAERKLIDEH